MEEKLMRELEAREAARRRKAGGRVVILIILILVFVGLVLAFWHSLASDVQAAWEAQEPAEGVGRAEIYTDAPLTCAADTSAKTGTALRVFCETEEPLPDWWDPESAEVVYEEPQPVRDIVALYWVPVILTGWDGWTMEEWEMDLFSRCFYLEFWGTSEFCCQAGCDAMLNLWTSGLYGRTMGESLSALNDFGKYVYSVYPYVWTTNYDAEGLAWCRDFCETRFQTGPTYQVMYFQLYGFHDPKWAIPCFMSDGVYFSARKGY